jgi:phosphatidylserine/phosphatidylglycerophosphate/cardiolipin synthase-like enzyme
VIDFARRRILLLLTTAFLAGCDGLSVQPSKTSSDESKDFGSEPSASAEGQASIHAFFSEVSQTPDLNRLQRRNIAAACARAIGTAQRTLDVCCHEIDNRVVVEAIIEAHLRGVKVRVITETDYLEELGPRTFEEAGIPMMSDNRSALMHNKFAVMDGVAVWTGSFNFTENCAYKNNNNGIYIRSPKVAENYAAWFDWFWTQGKNSGRRRGGPTPNLKVELADKTIIETRMTTFDKMDQLALEVIQGARKSIKFLAFSFTHEKMAAAMVERARKGVKVFGVFEQRNIAVSKYNMLADEPNISVLADGNPYQMHHKVIIVDDAVVLTGSFNFSKNAVESNDENYVVISRNAGIARRFESEFRSVYEAASQKLATKGSTSRR